MSFGKKSLAVTALAGAAVILTAPVAANHSWSTYHWLRTSNEITIPVIDNTTGIWAQNDHVGMAVYDWNASPYIEAPYQIGIADPACPIVREEINVCNDDYGQNGWLGIASISISSGHIVGGVTRLNDYYFNQDRYNNDTWRQLVTCQEIGHDYGLGHQNENFSTDVTNSCMEYTSQPAGNESPDQHDFDQLASIYAHSEGGSDGGGGGKPGKGGGKGGGNGGGNGGGKGKKFGVGNSPRDWGRPTDYDGDGRPNVFVRESDDALIVTHVTWAIGEGPKRKGNQHGGDDHGDHHH